MKRHIVAEISEHGQLEQRTVDNDGGAPILRLRFDASRGREEIERAIGQVLDGHYGPEPGAQPKPGRMLRPIPARRKKRGRP